MVHCVFHHGTHLDVKGRVVRGMQERAALKMEAVKYMSISEEEENCEGEIEMVKRVVKVCQSALS